MTIKQSTARVMVLKMYLAADHLTAATGKSLTVTVSKNGAAFGAIAGSVSEIANGWYRITFATSDTNTLGVLVVRATAADCDDAEAMLEVVAYDPQDAAGLGLSRMDAAVSSRLATSGYTAPDSAPAIAAAVWAAGTRTLTGFGSLIADMWAYAERTLTSVSGSAPTAEQNADALLDRTDGIEAGWTVRESLRVALSALAGKVSGAGTETITFRSVTDTRDRIVATVDADGNRSAVATDKS